MSEPDYRKRDHAHLHTQVEGPLVLVLQLPAGQHISLTNSMVCGLDIALFDPSEQFLRALHVALSSHLLNLKATHTPEVARE
mgnify:CR=1 FL=1